MKQDDDPPMLKYEMLAPKIDFTPEQRLWLAVLVRAIVDYGQIGPPNPKNPESPFNVHIKAATFLFAKRDQDKPASLGWIAEHLSDEPAALVRSVRRLARKLYAGQQVELHYRHKVRHAKLNFMIQNYA